MKVRLEGISTKPERLNFLPRSFALEKMKDVQLFKALYPLLLSLMQAQEFVDDTYIAVGSEVYAGCRCITLLRRVDRDGIRCSSGGDGATVCPKISEGEESEGVVKLEGTTV